MRTYIFIGCLAVIANLQCLKVEATLDPDIYLDDEGSGDTEIHFPDLSEGRGQYPPDDEETETETETGSGIPPISEGGGGVAKDVKVEGAKDEGGVRGVAVDVVSPAYDDDEDFFEDDYGDDYYDEEGSGGDRHYFENPWSPRTEDHDSAGDFSEPRIPVESIKPFEEAPERMPTTTLQPPKHDVMGEDKSGVTIVTQNDAERQVSIFAQPGILAAFIGGAVMGLLCAILLVMFIVYRMRKRDEGSYPLDEPKRVPLTSSYSPNDKEIYA